jgi:acyl-CoA synthetase (AMP-forming)/AMP-acid ligase II
MFGSSETGQLGGEAPPDDRYGAPRLRVDSCTDVLDDDLVPVPPGSGIVGHLARGGHVPVGYLGDPVKSAATFVEHAGRRWALPGDLATVLEDGSIVIFGRDSQCINTGGEKVFPEEVETVLKGHPDVGDAVVVGLPDERFGQRVVALVQPRAGRHVDPDAVRSFGRELLSGYKVPREIIVTDEIVRSPSGKPDYPWATAAAQAKARPTAT